MPLLILLVLGIFLLLGGWVIVVIGLGLIVYVVTEYWFLVIGIPALILVLWIADGYAKDRREQKTHRDEIARLRKGGETKEEQLARLRREAEANRDNDLYLGRRVGHWKPKSK